MWSQKTQTRKGGRGQDPHKESTQQFPPVDLGLTLAALEIEATTQGHQEQIRHGGGPAMAGPTAFQPSPGRCHSTSGQQGKQRKGLLTLAPVPGWAQRASSCPPRDSSVHQPPLTEASNPPLGKLSRAIFQKSLFLSAWTGPVL